MQIGKFFAKCPSWINQFFFSTTVHLTFGNLGERQMLFITRVMSASTKWLFEEISQRKHYI